MPSFQHASYVGHYSNETAVIPGAYNGMRVEVVNRENRLLFVADLQIISEQMVELVRTSELLCPEIEEGLPVSIRGFNAYQNCGIHMDGNLYKLAQSQDSAWVMKNLDVKGSDAGRSFTRRPMKAKAWVRPAGDSKAEWQECRVVNASAGGVCFRMAQSFQKGDKLSIRFRLRRGREQPPLTIAIRRVTEREGEFEYGSEFVDIDREVDTIITRTIIQLQIMQS